MASLLDSSSRLNTMKKFDKEVSQTIDHLMKELMMNSLGLEDSCSRLSREFDLCAVTSSMRGNDVAAEKRFCCNESSNGDNIPGFISPSAQISISAIRNGWNWFEKLVKCIRIHVQNSSNYHEFFAEFRESDRWMQSDVDKIFKSLSNSEANGELSDAKRILDQLKSVSSTFRLWRAKVDRMWSSACSVLPVDLRTTEVTEAIPARALCHYATKEIEFDEHEDLLLLRTQEDNARWRVSNGRGQTGVVPSVIILIPGNDPNAIKEAVRARLSLLEQWTDIMKTFGRHIISCMLHVFRSEYSEDEEEMVMMVAEEEKENLSKVLTEIEESLTSIWPEHPDFVLLTDRLRSLRKILHQSATTSTTKKTTSDSAFVQALIVQTNAVHQVLQTFHKNIVSPLQDLWRQWNVFRISPEVTGQSQARELVEKWEQENTANRVFFASFWRSETPLHEMEKTIEELCKFKIAGIILEDPEVLALKGTYAQTRSTHSSESNGKHTTGSGDSAYLENGIEDDEVDFEIGMETRIAKTEQYSSSESEESKKFIIRSVVDPSTQEEISLQESIDRGVIQPNEGTYHDAATGEIKPIPVAMKEGLIKVMFTTTKRSKEKKSSIGVITVKTIREQTRPYKVNSAIDTRTGKEFNREEAIEQDIIDEGRGTFINKQTGLKMLIAEAAQQGLVNIEYFGDEPSPEIISNTYAVHAVFDRGQQKLITFLDALRRGIIDKEAGTYHDTLTGQRFYISDAISQGYVKARPVDDVSKLKVDADNIFTVSTTETNIANQP